MEWGWENSSILLRGRSILIQIKKDITSDPLTVRVRRVSVDEEHVRDSSVWGQARPESQRREQLVAVVLLHDLAHCLNGELVLVQDLST